MDRTYEEGIVGGFGVIAAKVALDEFEQAVFRAWPHYPIQQGPILVPGLEAVWEMEQKALAAEGLPSVCVGFHQHGDWSIMLENSPLLTASFRGHGELETLSAAVGKVVVFWIQSSGGCAGYLVLDGGKVVRELANNDGEFTDIGEPQPEENGIAMDEYYLDETDQLLASFGITHPHEQRQLRAYRARDREEGVSPKPTPPGSPQQVPPSKRPWWRFW
jgi:hypothetical protein